MKLFDYSAQQILDCKVFPDSCRDSTELFVLCRSSEVPLLQEAFNFDEHTVLDCTDLDESVRYASYEGYDFISLVHMEIEGDDVALREINLYIAARYLVLVLTEHEGPRLKQIESSILTAAENMAPRTGRINRLYFLIFHSLMGDFSDMLETLEDQMETLSESITDDAGDKNLTEISRLRKMAYTAKKQLRALSYLGEQILIDENGLLDKKQIKYFRNIDTRLKKLYDFAESLYELGGELLHIYDSKLTIKTNEIVNKLTIITLFFAPLTVITGIYGMNFDFMPELNWKIGYPLILLIMASICLVLYLIMKKKKWL
jgi:magnesium transporter